MKEQVERIKYRKVTSVEELQALKEQGVDIDGVGCIIGVMKRNKIYAVDEVAKHKGTGIIGEKRRQGELVIDNVVGALVEEMGIEAGDFGDFYYVPGKRGSYLGRVLIEEDGKCGHVDVVLVHYAGRREIFRSANEVRGVGFVNPELLQEYKNFRRSMLPAMRLINQEGRIRDFNQAAEKRETLCIFDGVDVETFNREAFIRKRQELPDLYL